MLTTDQLGNPLPGTLTNEANVNFDVPEGQSKYLTAGNDVVDLSKWNGRLSVNIGDAFSGDNDKVTVMADALANNLKLTSIENLEIINSDVETPVILNSTNFKGLEAIKLIGDATTLNVFGLTQGIKVDATANADYIIGSNKADTINGGAGNDTIQGNQGNDVLTGGNGADTFIIGNAKDFGVDQILDFSAEDKIFMDGFSVQELKKFDASTFSTVTYKTLDSVLATFGSGGANATKNGDVVIFSYDGKTYALLANGAFNEANDALVDITGANVASLNESNFGAAALPITPTPTPGGNYNYENYAAFAADVALGVGVTNATIQTMTVAQAAELAPNYLTTTGKNALLKVADGGIKAITGDVITVTLDDTEKFDATKFDAKLDPSIITAGTVTMNITGSGDPDTIAASVLGGAIDGSGKTDTIKLNTGKDVVKISDKTAANGDNIIDFDVTKDVLSFKTTGKFDGLALNSVGSLTDVSTVSVIDTATVNTVYKGSLADLKANLKGDNTSNGKVILGVATDAGNEGIYALTLASDAVVSKAEKVVTLTGVDLNTLMMDNFATFA